MPDDELDGVWKALSDNTRRSILDLLRQGPRTTTEIVEAFPHLSRFGIMKHIDVPREAGLIHTREERRQRINSLNVVRSGKFTSAGSTASKSSGRAICCASKRTPKPKPPRHKPPGATALCLLPLDLGEQRQNVETRPIAQLLD